MTRMPWKRVLALGILLLVLLVAAVAGGVGLIFRSIRSCGAYRQGLALAQADARVAAVLGAPVEPDWYVMGSVQLANDAGHADFLIPLKGSKRLHDTPRTGRLHVVADRSAGVWTLRFADLTTMTGPDAFDTLPLLP